MDRSRQAYHLFGTGLEALAIVEQQRILVRPGGRRPPSEGHLVPIRREFFDYAAHIFPLAKQRGCWSSWRVLAPPLTVGSGAIPGSHQRAKLTHAITL